MLIVPTYSLYTKYIYTSNIGWNSSTKNSVQSEIHIQDQLTKFEVSLPM